MEVIGEEEGEEVSSEVGWAVLVEETTEELVVVDVLGITSVDEIEVELSTIGQQVLQFCIDIPASEEVVEGTISSLETVEEDTAAVD